MTKKQAYTGSGLGFNSFFCFVTYCSTWRV